MKKLCTIGLLSLLLVACNLNVENSPKSATITNLAPSLKVIVEGSLLGYGSSVTVTYFPVTIGFSVEGGPTGNLYTLDDSGRYTIYGLSSSGTLDIRKE